MKKHLLVIVALVAGYTFFNSQYSPKLNEATSSFSEKSTEKSDAIIANAFSSHETH